MTKFSEGAEFPPLGTDPSPEENSDSEYILVSDKTSEVLTSILGWKNATSMRKMATLIRKAGGEVTIFKATKY